MIIAYSASCCRTMNSSFFDLEVIWTDRTEGVHVVAAVLTALLVISIDFGYTSTDWSGICLLQSLLQRLILRFIAERI
jgi:hypothetical protein